MFLERGTNNLTASRQGFIQALSMTPVFAFKIVFLCLMVVSMQPGVSKSPFIERF